MEDREAQLRVLQEELSSVEALLESHGWSELTLIAQEQLQLRLPGVLKKLENFLEMPGQEFEKGAIAGIELFCSLPGIRCESLRDDIAKIEEELGYDEHERTSTRDSRDSGSGSGSGRDTGEEFEPPV